MNVLIIGPHPPLKGGISDFNHQLYLHLEEFKKDIEGFRNRTNEFKVYK